MSRQAPRKLLVVDDDPEYRRLLHALLVGAGYEVVMASDGAEGFRRIVADHPDIVLTDWVMPGMDGLELVRKVRAELSWYPYILLVTCRSEQQVGLDTGADDFIAKPIRGEYLLPRIRAGERIVTLKERLREKNLELNLVNQQLAELAVTDPLSGLLNRRAFYEESKKEWHRAVRYDLPLSCLMVDVDDFKRINDTFGHAAGDSVIRSVGRTLRTRLRDTDITCRYGGEEFCILLTNTKLDAAVLLAERLRTTFAELEAPQLPGHFRFTVSIGIAARSLQTLSEEKLIDDADQALLAAKRTGRNRAIRHDELDQISVNELQAQAMSNGNVAALTPTPISRPVVNTLLGALAYRDPATVAHCQRVATLCEEFGRFIGMAPEDRNLAETAALLHEVGRLAMPDHQLSEVPRSAEEDFALVEQAAHLTRELVQSCFAHAPLNEAIRHAGQWYDGSRGTPYGEDIPVAARILAIACLFDDARHGRQGWEEHTPAEALRQLNRCAAGQLDPQLVARFAEMIDARAVAVAAASGS